MKKEIKTLEDFSEGDILVVNESRYKISNIRVENKKCKLESTTTGYRAEDYSLQSILDYTRSGAYRIEAGPLHIDSYQIF